METKEKCKKSKSAILTIAIATMLLTAAVGLASATPITNCTELQNMKNDLSGDYSLATDIDCSCTATWNGGNGFEPIGSLANGFTGTFNGQGYTITNLFINRSATGYAGLFGYTGSDSALKNVSLGNISVSGHIDVGGLVGHNEYGTISNSSSTGSVSSSDNKVGGLVGYNKGTINNSYSTGCVTSNNHNQVGGLVGINEGTINNSYSTGSVSGNVLIGGLVGDNQGTINNSYSSGSVSGNSWAGGLVGLNCGGTISNSYWDNETSGQSTSAGGEGKTTAEMKQQATFVGWDFDIIWVIEENVTYPIHRWQLPGRPTKPFVVFGFVNHSTGNPLNGPNVTLTNMRTGEVFTAETNASFNYYQVITSSWNVSGVDVLHFNATNDNSTEFNHEVTKEESNSGGFRQDIIIDNPNDELSIEVNKTVWNGTAWVELVDGAELDDIYRFRCEIHNNGTEPLSDIRFWDMMSCSLEYADNATLNGMPVVLPDNSGNLTFKNKTLHPLNPGWDPYNLQLGEPFHELCPEFCNHYELTYWEDTNYDGRLSHCDQIEMENETGYMLRYHVELLPYTLTLTDLETGNITYFDSVPDYEQINLSAPLGTEWKEVCCCKESYVLVDWIDNGNQTLDFCDNISLQNIRTGEITEYHVEEVVIDLVVSQEWLINYWYPGFVLDPCNTVTIEFDARVVDYGEDWNVQCAKGWSWEEQRWVVDCDRAGVNAPIQPPGTCGDVAPCPVCDGDVNMGDVVLLLNNVTFRGNPTYNLCNWWAGDAAPCPVSDGDVNMGDVVLLLNNVTFRGNPTYNLCCA